MSPGRVLVVADDARLARFLLTGLRREGYEVEAAARGGEARSLDRARHADLVLLDHRIPDGSGELLRAWRAAGRAMPVVLLTERGAEGELRSPLLTEATALLTKPFKLDQLIHLVRSFLR